MSEVPQRPRKRRYTRGQRPHRPGSGAPEDLAVNPEDLSNETKHDMELWVKSVGTWENLQMLQEMVLGEARFDIRQILSDQNDLARTEQRDLFNLLLDGERWIELAKDPGKFDAELDRITGLIHDIQKWIYGMPDHRLRKRDDRDKRIYELRRGGKSFGEIAQLIKVTAQDSGDSLTAQSARQAYERYTERQQNILRRFARVALSRNPEQKRKLVIDFLEFFRSGRLR
jgi:hypothetical protein